MNAVTGIARAVAYVRKSTAQSHASDGLRSVEQQAAEAARAASLAGLPAIARTYSDDGVSGARFEDRPAFQQMVRDLTAKPLAPPGTVALVTFAVSRLGRETSDTLGYLKRIVQAGVRVFEVTGGGGLEELDYRTATGRMMVGLKAGVADAERENVARHTLRGLAERARRGLAAGGRVFGYDRRAVMAPDGVRRLHVEWAVNEAEARVVRELFEKTAAGWGLKRIAHDFNARGLPAPRPSSWVVEQAAKRGVDRAPRHAPSTLNAALRRTMYRGVITWNRRKKRDPFGQKSGKPIRKPREEWVVAPAEHLRVVSDELWDRAHARLARARATYLRTTDGRLEGRPPSSVAARYLLSGLAVCAVCAGGIQVVRKLRGRRGAKVPVSYVYVCATARVSGPSVCSNRTQVLVDVADRAVLGLFDQVVLDPAAVARIVKGSVERLRATSATADAERLGLARDLRSLDAQVGRLTDAVARAGDIDALVAKLREVEAARDAVGGRLRQLEGLVEVQRVDVARIEAAVAAKVANWRGLLGRHPAQARQVLQKLLAERMTFAPGRVHVRVTARVAPDILLAGLVPTTADRRTYRPRGGKEVLGSVAPTGLGTGYFPPIVLEVDVPLAA